MSDPGARIVTELAAAGTVVATVFDWLPKIAVALAIVWYLVQLHESQTWKNLFRKKKDRPND